jgi:hypothetical protein
MSPIESYSVRIGYPTVAAVAFSKIVDKLRCRRTVVRVRIPAGWVKVRVKGRVVRVHHRAQYVRERVRRCHPRTVRRRVTRRVAIRRHGKKIRVKRTRTVRVVLEPRTIFKTEQRVGHGKPATVHGWLGADTPTGVVALGGQTVDVLTAPDNGRYDYQVAAVTTTAANGSWSARLPAGPSRLITASFAGAPAAEPVLAAPAHLIVPAEIKLLSASPRRVAWGGLVRLTGQLLGGYLPPGGAHIQLRIGAGKAVTTYGVHTGVTGKGRFTTTYRFGAGNPATHQAYFFQLATLPGSAYPWGKALSRRLTVHVGGHPKPPRRRRRARRHHGPSHRRSPTGASASGVKGREKQ